VSRSFSSSFPQRLLFLLLTKPDLLFSSSLRRIAVYHLETGRLHNLHITVSPPEDDEEDWVAGDSQRARRGSQIERERLEDARLSALLEELKIPEQKESEEAILAAKAAMSEEPKSTV